MDFISNREAAPYSEEVCCCLEFQGNGSLRLGRHGRGWRLQCLQLRGLWGGLHRWQEHLNPSLTDTRILLVIMIFPLIVKVKWFLGYDWTEIYEEASMGATESFTNKCWDNWAKGKWFLGIGRTRGGWEDGGAYDEASMGAAASFTDRCSKILLIPCAVIWDSASFSWASKLEDSEDRSPNSESNFVRSGQELWNLNCSGSYLSE